MQLVTFALLLGAIGFAPAQATDTNACKPRPSGSGPVATPDTQYAFLNSALIESNATEAPEPANYTLSFKNLGASTNAESFIGVDTLTSYDTRRCAERCSAQEGCVGINIFYERNPSVNLSPDCPNPPSTTIIKCAFWGVEVNEENTNNAGYTDQSFVIAVAGSNGYNQGSSGDSLKNSPLANLKLLLLPLSLFVLELLR